MKFKAGFFVAVLMGVFMLTEIQCNKAPTSPQITSYGFAQPIVNPPDTFQVVYDLNIAGNLIAHITFQDSAVWKIQLLSQSPINYGFLNPAKDSTVYITSPDSIGFRGQVQYSFIANNINNNNQYSNLYFVQFTKLPLDYNSFPKRY